MAKKGRQRRERPTLPRTTLGELAYISAGSAAHRWQRKEDKDEKGPLCPGPHSASSLTSQLDLQPIDGKERKTKTRKAHTDANGPDPSGLPVITTQPIPPSSLHSTTPTYPIKPAEFLILGLAVVTTSRWQWVLCSVLFHATKGHTSTSQ